nr:hypothetical protein Iba_chr09aCG10170 [Ipomoea batatas]
MVLSVTLMASGLGISCGISKWLPRYDVLLWRCARGELILTLTALCVIKLRRHGTISALIARSPGLPNSSSSVDGNLPDFSYFSVVIKACLDIIFSLPGISVSFIPSSFPEQRIALLIYRPKLLARIWIPELGALILPCRVVDDGLLVAADTDNKLDKLAAGDIDASLRVVDDGLQVAADTDNKLGNATLQ